jgi:IS605 OrfB family transposase
MPEQTVQPSGARVGVDRGIVNPVAMVAVAADGRVLSASEPLGAEVGRAIRDADARRRAEQRRRGTTGHRHAERVEHSLHRLANRVVAEAKAQRAQVVVEKLDEFKRTIVAKRAPGARRGGWRRTLKRAQLGRLEAILAYKLALAGLPPPVEVVAGGTSQTCPACGHRAAENRAAQDRFACVACGFVGHADVVGAVNIARRGVAMEGIKRGDTLAPRERDMVPRLRARDDGGLGPLTAPAAGGFVAGRAAVPTADDPATGDTVGAGQNTTDGAQNAREGVFAARGAAFSEDRSKLNSGSRQGLGP